MGGAIGGVGIGMGGGMGPGPGMATAVGGSASATGVASTGRASAVATAPASGTKVSISAAAHRALAMDNGQAGPRASAPAHDARAAAAPAMTDAGKLHATAHHPATHLNLSTDVHVNATIRNIDINTQVLGFSDARIWDELVAALILALLLQDRKNNGG